MKYRKTMKILYGSKKIALLILIGVALLLAGCTGQDGRTGSAGKGEIKVYVSGVSGNVGEFDALKVNVSSVQLLGSTGPVETVRIDTKSVDLTEAGEEALLLGSIDVEAMNYSGVALEVTGLSASVGGEKRSVIMTNNMLKLQKSLPIEVGGSIVFDIQPVEIEGTEKYTLLPVPENSGVHGEDTEIALPG
ncbi:MAG: hypothetical protein SVV03_05645 [Candidatus Nanohaloarchaea archaeon]|nr:hypothetical protein [Candidatus Nanohaloarchaea archaeon]